MFQSWNIWNISKPALMLMQWVNANAFTGNQIQLWVCWSNGVSLVHTFLRPANLVFFWFWGANCKILLYFQIFFGGGGLSPPSPIVTPPRQVGTYKYFKKYTAVYMYCTIAYYTAVQCKLICHSLCTRICRIL